MRPPEDQPRRALVGQWLDKAETDLRAAEALREQDPPLLYPACFFCQQAAEKYLKAMLTWHQVEFPKTHIIGELLDLVASADPALAADLSSTTALNPYGVEVRYPTDQPEPDAAECDRAIALARQARDAVLAALPTA